MNQHNTPPPDDRVSAYLDGELSAEESAKIEHLIATDDRYSQLAKDLLQLQTRLKELPHSKLSSDLSARILQLAELKSLPPATTRITSQKSRRWSRAVWGVTAAMAASLLCMFLWSRQSARNMQPLAQLQRDNIPQFDLRSEQGDATLPEHEVTRKRSAKHSSDKSPATTVHQPEQGRPQGPQSKTAPPEHALGQEDVVPFKAILAAPSAEEKHKSRGRPQNRSLEPDHSSADDPSFPSSIVASGSPDLIILVDVPGEMIHQRHLDYSLVRHGIFFNALENNPASDAGQSNRDDIVNDQLRDTLEKVKEDLVQPSPATAADAAADSTKQPQHDLIFVSATHHQIQETLQDLQQHTDKFLRVTVRTVTPNSPLAQSRPLVPSQDLNAALSADTNPEFRTFQRAQKQVSGKAVIDNKNTNTRRHGSAKRLNPKTFGLSHLTFADQSPSPLSLQDLEILQEGGPPGLDANQNNPPNTHHLQTNPVKDKTEPLADDTVNSDRMVQVLFLVRATKQD